MNVKKGIRGFIKGMKPYNTGKSSWNKGIPSTIPRCPDCSAFISKSKKHDCKSVDKKGPRFCIYCGILLQNSGWERYNKSCGPCGKIIQREKERMLRAKLIKQFGGECKFCGYKKEAFCLEFHHLNKRDKKSKHFLPQIKDNPELFLLLCNRCHREMDLKASMERDKYRGGREKVLTKWRKLELEKNKYVNVAWV